MTTDPILLQFPSEMKFLIAFIAGVCFRFPSSAPVLFGSVYFAKSFLKRFMASTVDS